MNNDHNDTEPLPSTSKGHPNMTSENTSNDARGDDKCNSNDPRDQKYTSNDPRDQKYTSSDPRDQKYTSPESRDQKYNGQTSGSRGHRLTSEHTSDYNSGGGRTSPSDRDDDYDDDDDEEDCDDEISDAGLLRSMLADSEAYCEREAKEEKHCWVCFANEEDDMTAIWVHPCK